MTRTSFNSGWSVSPKVSPFAKIQGGGDGGVPVTLPHDAIITLPRSEAAPSGGRTAYFPGGAFEYSKSFDVPEEWRGRRVSLEFQGVYRDAMVYVNGSFAAQRPNGYSPFRVALDPFLRYGEANALRVDARAHDDSRWYTGAGIHRDVTLIVSDLVHIDHAGARVTTPDVDGERAVVEIVAPVLNEGTETRTVRVRNDIVDADGVVVASESAPITLRAGGRGDSRQRVYVPAPRLWSVETPTLYTVRTTLEESGDTLDEISTSFGIRTIRIDPFHGLRINGESVKLRGACIHHDNGPLGAAAIARAEERRVEILKEAGFNAIRSSHNPLSSAMLDACDRLGMLVMDETFDMWTQGKSPFDYSLSFPEWWERDVEALVEKDFNHPSVIFYSIGNEIFETGDAIGAEWGRTLAEKVRALDPTRLVTNGINPFVSVLSDVVQMMRGGAAESAGAEGGVNAVMNMADVMSGITVSPLASERTEASFSVLDVAGMNYSDARYEHDRERFPNRVIVGSETYPPHIAPNWKLVLDNPHVLGDFTWTGWDYLGEVGIGRVQYADETPAFEAPYPWLAAWVGDIDITGRRRPISYYREIVFGLRDEPYIAVVRPGNRDRTRVPGMWAWSDSIASWTWDVAEGTIVDLEVYADADEVELLVNGRAVARKAPGTSKPFLAEFEAPYERGVVEAVAYRDGLETGRWSLSSAGDLAALAAVPDRSELRSDDGDLAFVEIELHDADGRLVTSREVSLRATVEGPAVLQALASARPDTEEPFHSPEVTTFDGRALAILRPTGAGAITLTLEAEGLSSASVPLEVR